MAKLRELAEWRKKQGWSQADLAKKLDVDQTRISDWENGRRPLQLEIALRLRSLGYNGPSTATEEPPLTRADFEAYMQLHVDMLMAELRTTREEVQRIRDELKRGEGS